MNHELREAEITSEEPDIRVYPPGNDEHPMCTCCSTKVGVLRISFGTKGQKHSYVGLALCDRCRKVLIAKLMGR